MTNNVQTPGGNTTTDGAVEQRKMAKRIAWETVLISNGTTRRNMERAALAAIIETSERAAKLAMDRVDYGIDPSPYSPSRAEVYNLAAAIRNGDHLDD